MSMEKFNANDVVCKEGDPADRLYVIMEGSVEIVVQGNTVRTMKENDFFGESGLILEDGNERGATVNALTAGSGSKVTTLTLTRASFRQLVAKKVVRRSVTVSHLGPRLYNTNLSCILSRILSRILSVPSVSSR